MIEIKYFLCEKTPSKDEVTKAISIVQKEKCVVIIKWFIEYNGWHKLIVKENMTLEECMNRLPRCYGV